MGTSHRSSRQAWHRAHRTVYREEVLAVLPLLGTLTAVVLVVLVAIGGDVASTAPMGSILPTSSATDSPEEQEERIAELERELADLQESLEADPSNAIEVPLLADEIDDLTTRVDELTRQLDRQEDSTRAEVSRLDDYFKWGLGGILIALIAFLLARAVEDRGRKADSRPIDLHAMLLPPPNPGADPKQPRPTRRNPSSSRPS